MGRGLAGTGPINVLELRSVRGTGGGPEKTIMHGAAQTDRNRFRITVCYIRDRRDTVFEIDERARAMGVDYIEIVEQHSADPSVWRALRGIVRERGIHIVHAHEYKTDLLAWLLARVERIRPLATTHGWSGRSWRELRVYYPVDKRLLTWFPLVLAVSEPIRRELLRVGADRERVRVLRNGIDEERFRRAPGRVREARERFGLRVGDTAIGAVGRLDSGKRFDLLIGAFAALLPRHPSLKLLIAGEGDARPQLEAQIARLGIGLSCKLVGHVTDIIDFFHSLDLFVQSSDSEGSPNVVLEAMALETPVVATDVGGTADLINHDIHGLLVARGDAGILSETIETCLADAHGTRRRAVAARDRVERELSFRARQERLEAVYHELLQDASGAAR